MEDKYIKMFNFVKEKRKVTSPYYVDYANGDVNLVMKKIENAALRKEFDNVSVLLQLMIKNGDINNIRKIINISPHLIYLVLRGAINMQNLDYIKIMLTEFKKEFLQFIHNSNIERGILYGLPDEPSNSFLSFYKKYVDYYFSLIEQTPNPDVIITINNFLIFEGIIEESESGIKYLKIIWGCLKDKFKSSIKKYESALVSNYFKVLSLSKARGGRGGANKHIEEKVLPMFQFYFDTLNFDINNDDGKYFYETMNFGNYDLIKFFMDRGIRGVWVQRVAVDLDNIYPYDDRFKLEIRNYINKMK